MSNTYLSLRSSLAKAKNLGSSGHGSHHWLMQRLTALLMIPLFLWAAYFFYIAHKHNYSEILIILKQPLHLISMLMLLTVGIYHGMHGMQVVIEDYINSLTWRYLLIIKLKLFSFVTIFALIVTAIHFLTQN